MNTTLHRPIAFPAYLLGLTIPLASACAQGHSTGPSSALGHQEDPVVAQPFWIQEADLPAGFPAPGPAGQVVIKDYPAYRMAAFLPAEGRERAQNQMFWPLFQHIKRNRIAMTAPVEMRYPAAVATRPADAASVQPESMAFLYAQPTLGNLGPDREDRRVVVKDTPAMTVLSVGLRGNYDSRRLAKALAQLEKWLAENPGRAEIVGKPRYLGYNSPMVPGFLRYGEVQLPVRLLTEAALSSQ